jgi:hypothetical protein
MKQGVRDNNTDQPDRECFGVYGDLTRRIGNVTLIAKVPRYRKLMTYTIYGLSLLDIIKGLPGTKE